MNSHCGKKSWFGGWCWTEVWAWLGRWIGQWQSPSPAFRYGSPSNRGLLQWRSSKIGDGCLGKKKAIRRVTLYGWSLLKNTCTLSHHQNQKQTEKQERSATDRENRFSHKLKENTCFKLYSKVDSVSYQSRQVSSPSMCSLIHWGSCRGNQDLESLHLHLS